MSQSLQTRAEAVRISNGGDRIGLVVLVLTFLGGLWLMAAPFIVGYQDRTAHWATGTINIFVVGAGVAVLALATIIVFVAGILFELSRNSRQRRYDDEHQSSPSEGTTS